MAGGGTNYFLPCKPPFYTTHSTHPISNMLKSAIVAFALIVMSVTARDDRLTYKLKSGQTVAQFCSAWSQECYKYVKTIS